MVQIIQKENPALRKVSEKVPTADIRTPKIRKILEEMKQALEAEIDGVAIAAPQIGVSLRIFIVSHRAFEKESEIKDKAKADAKAKYSNLVCINPEFVKLSKTKKMLEEGCLSVRYAYGKVRRSTKAAVRAWDETGKPFERGASGLLAQIFQHEMDHLDGVLFIDNATDIQELSQEEIENVKIKSQNYPASEDRAKLDNESKVRP